ncbi:MAG: guanylate kinase [Desulfobulbales bacterium]
MKSGELFIISAPSGTGKTTVIKKVVNRLSGLAFSISHTTRKPRAGEVEGIAYHFVDKNTFAAMQHDDVFLEWAEVHGNFYGTSRDAILAATKQGLDIILDIDVQGALQVKQKLGNNSVSVFIAPPSLSELERRLAGRSTETAANMATRLANAREEMKSMDRYDYVIVNDTVDQAVKVLKSIIVAERSRRRRSQSGQSLNLVFK